MSNIPDQPVFGGLMPSEGRGDDPPGTIPANETMAQDLLKHSTSVLADVSLVLNSYLNTINQLSAANRKSREANRSLQELELLLGMSPGQLTLQTREMIKNVNMMLGSAHDLSMFDKQNVPAVGYRLVDEEFDNGKRKLQIGSVSFDDIGFRNTKITTTESPDLSLGEAIAVGLSDLDRLRVACFAEVHKRCKENPGLWTLVNSSKLRIDLSIPPELRDLQKWGSMPRMFENNQMILH